ncbi:MAG: hypothetical protein L3J44_08035, partial [Campylobacteraceae bacterium]|nr:hypothetical protein [Campylobacteraceae bacterium]
LEVVRGEKINAYYSILEKIDSSKIIIKRQFCGSEGTLMLRKIFSDSELLGSNLEFPLKLEEKGTFYIQRDNEIYLHTDIDKFQKNDIFIIFTKTENITIFSKWLHKNL